MADDIDKVEQDFMKGYRALKLRFGKLEHLLGEKDAKIEGLEDDILRLKSEVSEAEKGSKLWQETAEARQQTYDEYKAREREGFDMIIKAVTDYMERHETYRDMTNKYGGAVMLGYKGLTNEQKERFTKYIEKKTTEVKNYAKRLRDGKI